jgi:type 1 glutamine amidotransferase
MKKLIPIVVTGIGMMLAGVCVGAEPLRVLMITGGCCHDYESQKKILSEGISARANVSWTIVHEGGDEREFEVSVYKKPDWTKGYDVVLHNECFGRNTNSAFVEQIARGHAGGVGAVVVHCSIHSYRFAETDEWRKLLGISSVRHQQHVAVEVENLNPEHPVMKGFPGKWPTPNGELYEVEKIWPNTIPLAQAFGVRTKKDHVCVWVNTYEKARVFGTTLGHFNEEMDNDVFLDLITRGLLWASHKLDENGQPKPGYGAPAKQKAAQ